MLARDPGWYFSCTITPFVHISVHIVLSIWPSREGRRKMESGSHQCLTDGSGHDLQRRVGKVHGNLLRERSVALVGGGT
jgi:hypothetical protein